MQIMNTSQQLQALYLDAVEQSEADLQAMYIIISCACCDGKYQGALVPASSMNKYLFALLLQLIDKVLLFVFLSLQQPCIFVHCLQLLLA